MWVPTELISNTITYGYYSDLSWWKWEMIIVFQEENDLLMIYMKETVAYLCKNKKL